MQPPRIFQSTLPQGERRLARVREKHHKRFQSTLPQGERRRSRIRRTKVSTISIHAPTRGATRHNHNENRSFRNFNPRSHKGSDEYFHFCSKMLKISIHAPTRGATKVQIELEDKNIFQSTLPQGERRIGRFCSTGRIGISIHAPTRGATTDRLSMQYRYTTFQSTLPQGERLAAENQVHGTDIHFNPRSHKGSDAEQQEVVE